MANAQDILTLLALPEVGRRTVSKLFGALEPEPAGSERLHELLHQVHKKYEGFIPPSTARIERARKEALILLEKCRRLAIHTLTAGEENFPASLLSIPDPPLLLFIRGNSKCLSAEQKVAVVGTREPSAYGEKAAFRLGSYFAEKGWTLVSGLARGCDTAAHRGCLDGGGTTLAFLAHGLDIVYPPENRPLAADILKSGGCLVSEYAPGVPVEKHRFIERDRLQSGLSRGVIVVETDLASGTMHTIYYALAQKRPLACLRHPEKYAHLAEVEGNRKFIASGEAFSCSDSSDIDRFIGLMNKKTFKP